MQICSKFLAFNRLKFMDDCSGAILEGFGSVSGQMADEDCPRELAFIPILTTYARRDAQIPQIAKKDDIEIATSLVQIAEEFLHCKYSMQDLKSIC